MKTPIQSVCLVLLLASSLASVTLAGCGSSSNPAQSGNDGGSDGRGSDASTDSPPGNDVNIPDANNDVNAPDTGNDVNTRDTGAGVDAGCVDDAGGFVCCVENMIDNETTSTGSPDPAFCNFGGTDDPNAFGKYFP